MPQRAIDGDYIYLVTTNTHNRVRFFISPERAELLGRIIRNSCRLKHFDLLGYCILPDHLHLLVKNKNIALNGQRVNKNNLSDLLHAIKRNYSRQINIGKFWQSRFNFRFIADEKRFGNAVGYMQNNYLKHGHDAKYGHVPFLFIDWAVIHNTLKN